MESSREFTSERFPCDAHPPIASATSPDPTREPRTNPTRLRFPIFERDMLDSSCRLFIARVLARDMPSMSALVDSGRASGSTTHSLGGIGLGEAGPEALHGARRLQESGSSSRRLLREAEAAYARTDWSSRRLRSDSGRRDPAVLVACGGRSRRLGRAPTA